MKKRILSLILMIAVLLGTFVGLPITTSADSSDYDYIIYTDDDGIEVEITITKYKGSSKEVVIPSHIRGLPVTVIGGNAFLSCINIESITIPNTVTRINHGAFVNCTGLTSITIPGSVEYIDIAAFADCIALKKVTMNEGLLSIGQEVFAGCEALENISIPSSVNYIYDGAFYFCTGLENIEVDKDNANFCSENGVLFDKDKTSLLCYPAGKANLSYEISYGVYRVEPYAFSGAGNLENLTIPSTVCYTEGESFEGCTGLKSIEVDEQNENYCSESGILFSKDKDILMRYPAGKTEVSYSIPKSVIDIRNGAFSECVNLKKVKVPEGVEFIEPFAFMGCSSLEKVNIPSSVKHIEMSAFMACRALKDVVIGDGVTTIGAAAFADCISLTNIVIPGSVIDIGMNAFLGCESLTDAIMGEGVENIDKGAFSECAELRRVTIPKSVMDIGEGAFLWCDNLKEVYYLGSEADWKKISIGKNNGKLTDARIYYNAGNENIIMLSKTSVSATAFSRQVIHAVKADGITPYDGGFKVESGNPLIVITSKKDNQIILNCLVPGTTVVTVSATDGSGKQASCIVNVGEKKETEEDYLMERFALSQLSYSETGTQGYNLIVGRTVGDELQKANKSRTMFYLTPDDEIKYGKFYKKYINDYKVLKVPEYPYDSFYAAAFESPEGDIVIAYRGTDDLKMAFGTDFGTDIGMVFGMLSTQFDQALNFYDIVKNEYPDKKITLTGHSLGGALAAYVAMLRNVRCDNVNGATGLVCREHLLDEKDDYPVWYEGFDKYVFDNHNASFWTGNSFITINNKCFNLKDYEDSENYNKLKDETKLKRNHHSISSILNYNDGNFGLTEVKKTYNGKATWNLWGLGNTYMGTSGDDICTKYRQEIIDEETGEPKYSHPNLRIVCGGGNDTVVIVGNGNDILIGNSGDDSLNGGAGNDRYVFGGDFGNDIIQDPTGADEIIFTDKKLSELSISGNVISCGTNSIEVNKGVAREDDFTIVDKDNAKRVISFSGVSRFSLNEINSSEIKISGNSRAKIYNAREELIDTVFADENSQASVEFKDYGMVAVDSQMISLTLLPERYIVKIESDDIVDVWAVSDADNPTVAKQTFATGRNLLDGSVIVVDTGKLVEEQLSVKLINEYGEEDIFSQIPEPFTVSGDKSEIKTGEAVTLSVPEAFAGSVQWECSNKNVLISKNEDLSVEVIGYAPGEDTIKAFIPNDELYSAEFSLEITEDSAPVVEVVCNGEYYDGAEMVNDAVSFDVELAEGYDEVVFDTQSEYSQGEDADIFTVYTSGEHFINVYCKNSVTGARTDAFSFEFRQDCEAPIISGVKDGAVYYIDRIVDVSDENNDSVYVNGEQCEKDELIISDAGNYTISAQDFAGNETRVSFEIKAMPQPSDIDENNVETVTQIRNDFEEIKYLLSSEKMEELEALISELEEERNNPDGAGDTLPVESYFSIEKTDTEANIYVDVSNASDSACVYVASYNAFGKMLEIKKLTLQDGCAAETFSVADVRKYKLFVWNGKSAPLAESKECYIY